MFAVFSTTDGSWELTRGEGMQFTNYKLFTIWMGSATRMRMRNADRREGGGIPRAARTALWEISGVIMDRPPYIRPRAPNVRHDGSRWNLRPTRRLRWTFLRRGTALRTRLLVGGAVLERRWPFSRRRAGEIASHRRKSRLWRRTGPPVRRGGDGMSKLSFRARALDANKPMPVYRASEVPDLAELAAVNRAVVEMPTGMEKEEETVGIRATLKLVNSPGRRHLRKETRCLRLNISHHESSCFICYFHLGLFTI